MLLSDGLDLELFSCACGVLLVPRFTQPALIPYSSYPSYLITKA